MSILLDNALELVRYFGDVATANPTSAVLLAIGAVVTGVAVAVFGGLTLGAVLAPLSAGKY